MSRRTRALGNPLTAQEIILGGMMGLAGYAMAGLADQFIQNRKDVQRQEYERTLTQAPLSAEQASQERIWRRMRDRCTAASHTEMRDDEEWATLEKVPDWIFGDEVLEQRNCPKCGSTLARRKNGTWQKVQS